tara:strand:- start:1218 stop:2480 length:1263 start_codon:yes stop_codon:yes gene_type:complete
MPYLLAWFAFFELNIIEPKKHNGKNLFALSHFRFRGELEVLSSNGFRIFYLDSLFISSIQHYFFKGITPNLKDHHNPSENSNAYFAAKNLNKFYREFIKSFLKIKKIDVVISAMAHYPQDMHFGNAFNIEGIPFIVLHRAGVVANKESYKVLIKRYQKMGIFKGSRIVVQNKIIKEILINSGYCNENKIVIIGPTRMNMFRRNINNYKFKTPTNNILTLFSFTHSAGRSIVYGSNNIHFNWTTNNKEGLVSFFDNVHSQIAFYALSNPHIKVNIKLKWEDDWYDKVEYIVKRVCGGEIPKNLSIISGNNGSSLVSESKVVVAFGSTVLLEAGLLGKHVILPIFDEAGEKTFLRYFPLYEAVNGCYVAKNKEELFDLASSLMNTPVNGFAKNKRMLKLYEKYLGKLEDNTEDLLIKFLKEF